MRWLAVGGMAYLSWMLVAPFIPALVFGFALAMVGDPTYVWINKKLRNGNLAALVTVVLICLTLVLPMIFLVQVFVAEAMDAMNSLERQQEWAEARRAIEANAYWGSMMHWMGERFDLPKEIAQLSRGLVQWASTLPSTILTSSAWAITQMATMVVVLFYFLRDQESMLENLRWVLPLEAEETERLFQKITETIRVSLYGKVVVSLIQGGLGGIIFWCLSLPAPVFWGFVMALVSVVPVLGAFVIWVPAALILLAEGHWGQAAILTVWGVLIVNPVDNFLGPVLVGSRLKLHTLVIFFSVIGGLAAFGASGIILGPIIASVGVGLFDMQKNRLKQT